MVATETRQPFGLELYRAGVTALAEQDLSHDQIRDLIRDAILEMTQPDPTNPWAMPWVREVYDDRVIYEWQETLYQASYTVENDTVTLGDSIEVRVEYVPVEAGAPAESWRQRSFRESLVQGLMADPTFAQEVETVLARVGETLVVGEPVEVTEQAIRADGSALVKIIQPGWGSSGYYDAKMLERDGPKAFPKGTQMYWDHQTAREEAERPEGSLTNLAGVMTSDARYQEAGPKGPGLYADAQTFDPFRSSLEEIAPHIGVSLRALANTKPGEAEGRQGPIITNLVAGKSVDFVTQAGAGGQIVEAFRARRGIEPTDVPDELVALVAEHQKRNGSHFEAALPSHKTPTSTGSWDGAAAEKALGDSPSKAALRKLYAWVDPEGDASTKAAYKFPHHEVSDGTVGAANLAACAAVKAVLAGGRGGASIPEADKAAVERHVQKHIDDGQPSESRRGSDMPEVNEAAIAEAEKTAREATERAERAETALLIAAAERHATAELAKPERSKVPAAVKARITERVTSAPAKTEDGKLDETAQTKAIDEAVEAEMKYLTEALGRSGQVHDLGASQTSAQETEADEARVAAAMRRLNRDVSEETAKGVAAGR